MCKKWFKQTKQTEANNANKRKVFLFQITVSVNTIRKIILKKQKSIRCSIVMEAEQKWVKKIMQKDLFKTLFFKKIFSIRKVFIALMKKLLNKMKFCSTIIKSN